MAKKSLQDMLDEGLGDITGAKEATKAIVNRQVTQPPQAVPDTTEKEVVKEKKVVVGEDKYTHEEQDINQDLNLNVYQNLNEDKPLVLLEVERPLKFYDTHKNESFLVRRDIMAKVNALCKKGGRGFKTKFINEALRAHLARYGVDMPE